MTGDEIQVALAQKQMRIGKQHKRDLADNEKGYWPLLGYSNSEQIELEPF